MNIFQAIADAITCHDVAYVREQLTECNDNFVIAVNGVDTPGVLMSTLMKLRTMLEVTY